VFLTTCICTNNLFLLFGNTTGMTHLKILNCMFGVISNIDYNKNISFAHNYTRKSVTFKCSKLDNHYVGSKVLTTEMLQTWVFEGMIQFGIIF